MQNQAPQPGFQVAVTVSGVMTQVRNIVNTANLAFFALCGAGLVLFSIYLGFRMAKADDEGKRKQAREQLVWSIIGLIAVVAMVSITRIILPRTQTIGHTSVPANGITNTKVTGVVQLIMTAVSDGMTALLGILGMLVGMFAVYIGFQLMKAEDEGKRTNAKKQLFWAICGILGVIAINTISKTVCDTLVTNINNSPKKWEYFQYMAQIVVDRVRVFIL